MMDIDLIVEKGLRLDWLTGAEVTPAVAHQERIEPLVRGAIACAERKEAIRLEARLLNGDRLHSLSPHEGNHLGQITRKSGLNGTTIELA